MKFEDWFWYNNHTLFEHKLNQNAKCLSGKKMATDIRLLLGVLMLIEGLLSVSQSPPLNAIKDLMYFTIWGRWLTVATLLVGGFVYNPEIEMVEDLNYQDKDFLHHKYTPFRAWKWYCVLFELTFVVEFLITIFFWAALNNKDLYEGRNLI